MHSTLFLKFTTARTVKTDKKTHDKLIYRRQLMYQQCISKIHHLHEKRFKYINIIFCLLQGKASDIY